MRRVLECWCWNERRVNPLAGVPILAIAEIAGGAKENEIVQQIPFGLLASDQAGYVSFDPKSLGLMAGVAMHHLRNIDALQPCRSEERNVQP